MWWKGQIRKQGIDIMKVDGRGGWDVQTQAVEINLRLTFLQVSKPLMEKKRRARINQCLDELKSLLESYYSSSVSAGDMSGLLKDVTLPEWSKRDDFYQTVFSQIRKRKLEKADILELTVKHLRNLQKIQSSESLT